jgi:hypothetical protein
MVRQPEFARQCVGGHSSRGQSHTNSAVSQEDGFAGSLDSIETIIITRIDLQVVWMIIMISFDSAAYLAARACMMMPCTPVNRPIPIRPSDLTPERP